MASPEFNIRLRGSAITNQGRVRQNNEDSVDLWIADQSMMAIVADGMGGAVAGEEASRIAVETIREELFDDAHPDPDSYYHTELDILADRLKDVVFQANFNIVSRAKENPDLTGMGTTVTMAFSIDDEVILAHVGDSRAYLVDGHDGAINQLTADHSFVQALVDAGHITPEEAETHPMGNVLYRALGQAADIDIDIYRDVKLHVGDRMILCSDGLTLHVSTDEIGEIAMMSREPNEIAQMLVNTALERGGRDNVTVIVILADFDSAGLDLADLGLAELDDETLPTIPDTEPHIIDDMPNNDDDDPTPSQFAYQGYTHHQNNDIWREGHDTQP